MNEWTNVEPIDDEDPGRWDGYWRWRTEHPDEYEEARLLEELEPWE